MCTTRWIGFVLTLALLAGAGCDDVQRLYDAATLGQHVELETEYEGRQTVLGVPNVTCFGPNVYGITVTNRDYATVFNYVAAFATDESGTIVARAQARQWSGWRLSLIPFLLRSDDRYTVELQFVSPADDTSTEKLRDLQVAYFAAFSIDEDTYCHHYIDGDDFWRFLAEDGDVRMECRSDALPPGNVEAADMRMWAIGRREPLSPDEEYYEVQTSMRTQAWGWL